MSLPSVRELELELVLTQRDARIAELTDDLSNLRLHLQATTGQGPTTNDEPVTLPRPIVSLLVNHLSSASDRASGSSSSVATALTQRMQLLQEENDELYMLLRRSETGKLKEQVTTLNQTIASLEAALQDSHSVIRSMSAELDKAYAAMQVQHHRSATPSSIAGASPIVPRSNLPGSGKQTGASHNGSSGKPVPTGPRAQKRPRLSSPNATAVRDRGASRERGRERERERDRPPHEDVKERNKERERPSRSQSPTPRKTRRSRSPARGRGGSNGISNDMPPPPPRGPDLWPPADNDSGNGGGSRRGGRRGSPGNERERPKRSGGRRKNGGGGRQRDRGLVERLGL